MITDVLNSRCKDKIGIVNYAIITAPPAIFLGMGIYSLVLGKWPGFFITFPFAVLTGVFAYLYNAERARLKRSSLTIDPQRKEIVFRNFRFVAAFLPEKPRAAEIIRFNQVLASRWCETERGVRALELRTEQGKVVISEAMEHFATIGTVLGELIELNRGNADEYRKKLAIEPKIGTPWYGWLILVAAVVFVGLAGWEFTYRN